MSKYTNVCTYVFVALTQVCKVYISKFTSEFLILLRLFNNICKWRKFLKHFWKLPIEGM